MRTYTAAYVQKRKDSDAFRAFVDFYEEDGKRRKKSKTLKAKTKREANREAEDWLRELERQELESDETPEAVKAANMLVPDYVESFIDIWEQGKSIEPSTVKGYRSTAKYIRYGYPKGNVKGFEKVKVKDLRKKQVEEWSAGLTASGLTCSPVKKALGLLKQVMTQAVYNGVVVINPCNGVKPPKKSKKNEGINALTAKGLRDTLSILASLEQTPVTVGARIALFTGMREGEICGLKWKDVDLENKTLWVRGAIGRAIGGTYEKNAKTDRVRDICLPDSLIDILGKWLEVQRAEFREYGRTVGAGDYVLGDMDGYLSPDTLSKGWSAISKVIGVKGTEGRIPTFHDLRHTWATRYLAEGGDVKTASSVLGHANAAITLNRYASADPDAKRRSALLTEAITSGRVVPESNILELTGTDN